jgi:catechol 2,3-dioxygenase-like lactoylglutathione lyase family enzyme
MLGYCLLGTNDLNASAEFYDQVARILGHGRVMESERSIMWGSPGQGAMFGIITPIDGKEATVGNGTNFGFAAQTDEQVDRIYEFALANGGSDEGPPGARSPEFYGAYFRDPAGHKLVAFHFRGEPPE